MSSPLVTPSPKTSLSLKNVGVKYGLQHGTFRKKTKEFWALKDVSFDLYQGETLGVLGSNGGGKSTLLKVLAGIITVDRGSFTVEDNLHVQLLTLGLGFEAPLSGRMNAMLSGMLLGKSLQYMESRIEKIIEFSELGDFIDQPIFTYSSGMMTRLGFAVALEAECDILLIDEALAVGDGHFQKKSASAIQHLMDSQKTLVLVSHSIKDIQEFCKRAVWIDQGVTRAVGPVDEVFDLYSRHVHDKTNHVVRSIQPAVKNPSASPVAPVQTPVSVPIEKAEPINTAPKAVGTSDWQYFPEGWDQEKSGASGWDEESAVKPFLNGWSNYQKLMAGTRPLGFLSPAAVQFGNPFEHEPTLWAQNVLLMFAYSLSMASGGKSKVSMLDYGGSLGYYRLVAQQVLPEVSIDYTCLDMEPFCKAGRELQPDATFTSDEREAFAKEYDFVLAMGSLQYLKDWQSIISRFAESTTSHLLIGRLAVVYDVPSFVVGHSPRQHGFVETQYQWFLNIGEVIQSCADHGLILQREFIGGESHHIPGVPEQPKFNGYLFRRK